MAFFEERFLCHNECKIARPLHSNHHTQSSRPNLTVLLAGGYSSGIILAKTKGVVRVKDRNQLLRSNFVEY